jgi:hypothetical protein
MVETLDLSAYWTRLVSSLRNGFEVRTPHRGHFSSCCRFADVRREPEQIKPVVAAARREAVAIEELEDLNCDLSAVIEPIAQLRRAEFPSALWR